MYSLVDVDPKKEYGVARLSEWKAVQDGLKRNLVAMLSHYRHASYSVAPDHLLVQILQSINVPISLSSDRYYNNIGINAMAVANTFDLTTPMNSGKVFHGVFFNKTIQEIVIGFDENFDMARVEAHWQDVTPVRVLRHPFPHVHLQVPNGRFASPYSGLAVIAVNVSLLAVQYRAFSQAEARKQQANSDYVQRNIMQFVHMHVLPNMLESYLDYALFNRMEKLYHDQKMVRFPSREALHMPDYTHQVDAVYHRVINILDASNYHAPAMLAAMPAASTQDMRSVMFVPDVAPTRQILWSVILARLPMLLFLIQVSRKTERVQNQTGLTEIEYTLERLKKQRVFDTTLPKQLYQTTMAMIDEIIAAL